MKTICYLAMTAEEIALCEALPEKLCWMACHFSPYGLGLTNFPRKLPEDGMLIINDRIPFRRHDPEYILQQLKEIRFGSLLLDFQCGNDPAVQNLAQKLVGALPCPVAVSPRYAEGLDCPVFLPPVPPDTLPESWFSKWAGRECWLETSFECLQYTVTGSGTTVSTLPHFTAPSANHLDERLHCHYAIEAADDRACFTLYRTAEDIFSLLEEARPYGVTRAVGLYQEWKPHLQTL